MNSCSEEKSQEIVVDNGQRPPGKNSQKINAYFPSMFFGICFLAAWVWRAVATGSPTLDASVILVAAIATLLVVNQRLPMQNVVGLVVTIAVFWWVTLLMKKASGIFISSPHFKFHFLREYVSGLFWVVGIINARGVAKLILHRARKSANFGLGLLVLSSLLLVVEDSGTRKNFTYLSAKLGFVAMIFAATTPWFIDKKKMNHQPDYQPLLITILLVIW